MGHSFIFAFQIPKIGDVCCCISAASSPIMKWMVPGDWAHLIGLVRYAIALADCSKSISMWGILLSQHSEFRKLVMFVAVSQQAVIGS